MKKILFATLLCASAGLSAGSEFFPLAPNNTWIYRNAKSGNSLTVRVGTPVYMQTGRIYYYLTGYTPQRLLVRINEHQNLVSLDEETGRETVVTPFEEAQGAWWDTSRGCGTQARVKERPGTHEGPAGPWSNVQEIEFRKFSCADTGAELEQYVENIGMVRRVDTTFAGPATYDLVYAHVGTQVIEAGERGRFSVAVTQNTAGTAWVATLRTDLGNTGGVRLRFPSSQEYDVALRNSDGAIVWTWSMDKLFLQSVHDKLFTSEWSATVEVPYPAGAFSGSEYTIEGWLTTERQPKFAAAAQVYLPSIPAR